MLEMPTKVDFCRSFTKMTENLKKDFKQKEIFQLTGQLRFKGSRCNIYGIHKGVAAQSR